MIICFRKSTRWNDLKATVGSSVYSTSANHCNFANYQLRKIGPKLPNTLWCAQPALPFDPNNTNATDSTQDFVSKYPPSYYHRDPARSDFTVSVREANSPLEIQHKINFSSMEKVWFGLVSGKPLHVSNGKHWILEWFVCYFNGERISKCKLETMSQRSWTRLNICCFWPQEGFVPVRGLQVSLKTKEKDDKVLLICNLPTSTQETWMQSMIEMSKDVHIRPWFLLNIAVYGPWHLHQTNWGQM